MSSTTIRSRASPTRPSATWKRGIGNATDNDNDKLKAEGNA